MTFANTYTYSNREFFDLRTLFKAIRLIVVNFILTLIFLFLTIEELEWATFSSKEQIKDEIIDETSWNLKTLIYKILGKKYRN